MLKQAQPARIPLLPVMLWLVALLLVVGGTVAYNWKQEHRPFAVWFAPPLYPGAHDVSSTDYSRQPTQPEYLSIGNIQLTTRLTTAATAQQVREYYRRELSNAGWREIPMTDQLMVFTLAVQPDGPGFWSYDDSLVVTIEPSGSESRVEIHSIAGFVM